MVFAPPTIIQAPWDSSVRLRELDAENRRLKRLYADLALENPAVKEVLARKL
jgi:hypothetical protein